MTAFILAAGKGTRLYPITKSIPKPMVRIAGRPLLEHTIEHLASQGIKDLIINLNHCGDKIRAHFGDGQVWGVRIRYSPEAHLLGTAGALVPWRHEFTSTLLVVYGDNLSTCDLGRLGQSHVAAGSAATIALFHREDVTQSGVAVLDPKGWVTEFVEKPAAGDVRSHWVNAGVLLLEPRLLWELPNDRPVDFGKHLLPRWASRGQVFGYQMSPHERLWWADAPADLEMMQREFPLAHPPMRTREIN